MLTSVNYTLHGHKLNFYVIANETEWSEAIPDVKDIKDCFGKKRPAMTEKKCSIYDRLQYSVRPKMQQIRKASILLATHLWKLATVLVTNWKFVLRSRTNTNYVYLIIIIYFCNLSFLVVYNFIIYGAIDFLKFGYLNTSTMAIVFLSF